MIERPSWVWPCARPSVLAGTGAASAGKANDTFVWATSTEMGPPDLYYGNQREVLIIAYAQCDTLLHRDPGLERVQAAAGRDLDAGSIRPRSSSPCARA